MCLRTLLLRSLCFLLSLLLSACTTVGGSPTPTLETRGMAPPEGDLPTSAPAATASEPSRATPTLKPATYYFFEPGVSPLTGLPAADPTTLDRRPVMVKVSNWPREGRPHAGLSQADVVFEYFIGHQMNRFLAIYYGENADVIGPVRSGRLVDAQLTQLYQGLLAYGDADPQVEEVLAEALGERALTFRYLPCPPMCGVSTHDATGVFTDSGAITDYAIEMGIENAIPDLRGMYFEPEPFEGEARGATLRVEYANFSIMEWRYAEETGDYHLWQEAAIEGELDLAPTNDRNTGKSLTFDNLVVMVAEYIEYAPSLHDIRIQEVRAPQPALFFRDGIMTRGTWRVPEPDRPIIFELDSGESMPFKPGRTWIVIVGPSSNIVDQDEGEWLVEFGL